MDITHYNHNTSLEEFAVMSEEKMLEYVYKVHKKTGASVRDVFISIYEHLGKTIVNDMVGSRNQSWNNTQNFQVSSMFSEIAAASFFALLLLNVVLTIVLPNESFSWNTFVANAVGSTIITWIFFNIAGKNERRYLSTVHKVQHLQLRVESLGFRTSSGEALSIVDEDSITNTRQ